MLYSSRGLDVYKHDDEKSKNLNGDAKDAGQM
jgi:hypothetical protein